MTSEHQETASGDPAAIYRGLLHIFVAFDWGDEVNLELARKLVPAEVHALPRRRRTPARSPCCWKSLMVSLAQ